MKVTRYFLSPEYEQKILGRNHLRQDKMDDFPSFLDRNGFGNFLFDGRVLCSIDASKMFKGFASKYSRGIEIEMSPPEGCLPKGLLRALKERGYQEVNKEDLTKRASL